MDIIDKTILTSFCVASLSNEDPMKVLEKSLKLSQDCIQSRIVNLEKNGLIDGGKNCLTDIGRNSLRVVLAGGVFDIIHPGHIHTLNAAKALGDVLVVVIATDKTAVKMKKRVPLHNQELRKDLVNSLSMVDLALVGNEQDIFKTVDHVKPQIIALGYDQVHQEKFIIDGCMRIGLEVKVARLQSPVPEISSSDIEKKYGDSIHDI